MTDEKNQMAETVRAGPSKITILVGAFVAWLIIMMI